MGLHSGDVILALNDQPFGDPQQAIASLEQLTAGVRLVATIDRGGSIERVNLEGSLILADQARTSLP